MVTGTNNTNYTAINGATTTIDTEGTKIYSTITGLSCYVANTNLTDNFTIQLTYISMNFMINLAIFDTSNNILHHFDYRGGWYLDDNSVLSGNALSTNDIIKIVKSGSTYTVYKGSTQLLTFSDSTSSVRFGFRTNADSNRWQKFKDLTILQN